MINYTLLAIAVIFIALTIKTTLHNKDIRKENKRLRNELDVANNNYDEIEGELINTRILLNNAQADVDHIQDKYNALSLKYDDIQMREMNRTQQPTVAELRKQAKARGIKGYSGMRKAELVKALEEK